MAIELWIENVGAVAEDPARASDNVNALREALNAAKRYGNRVRAGEGRFYLDAGIGIPSNVHLQGVGWSNLFATAGTGTTFIAAPNAKIDRMFYADMVEQGHSANVCISDMTISGNWYSGAEVGVGVHLFGLAHKMKDCFVGQMSGTGVLMGSLEHNPLDVGYYWIWWLTRNRITNCGEHALIVATTDGFAHNNYISASHMGVLSVGGGNAWTANHFDNVANPNHAAMVLQEAAWLPDPHISEYILGNYFDVSANGLLLAGSGAAKTNFIGKIADNTFRANYNADVVINGMRNVRLTDNVSLQHRGNGHSIVGANTLRTRIIGHEWHGWGSDNPIDPEFRKWGISALRDCFVDGKDIVTTSAERG